jgi:hypothetical protein
MQRTLDHAARQRLAAPFALPEAFERDELDRVSRKHALSVALETTFATAVDHVKPATHLGGPRLASLLLQP